MSETPRAEQPVSDDDRVQDRVTRARERWVAKLIELEIPEYMHDGVLEWLLRGRVPGHFLQAVFKNDLCETFARADENNRAAVRGYVQFLYNYAPCDSFGGKWQMRRWAEQRGFIGLLEQQFAAADAEGGE